jgi:hypothetical protein
MATRETLSGVAVVIDMSSRDYYGYRDDVLGLIPSLTPLWTDLHPQDPGVVTVELFCAVADNLSFYEDRVGNENFLHTCTQRESGIKFARFVAYTPRQNTSALLMESVTVSGAGVIPAGFAVGTAQSAGQTQVRYELREEYTATGAGTVTLEFVQGESYDNEPWSSDGQADQSFQLTRTPLAFNPDGTPGLEVWVKEGAAPWEKWALVNDFQSSTATSKHYVIYVDEEDVVDIKFGDDVNGKIPASGTNNLQAIARIGGGIIGNQVGTNLVTQILESSPGIVTAVNNLTVPQGGQDKESLEELKINIPRWIRTNDRAVTEDDYAFWAESVGGVASAKATRGDNVGGSAYEMYVYVRAAGDNPVPAGTWDSRLETGTGLLGQVGAVLAEKRAGPVRVHIQGPFLVHSWTTLEVHILDTYFQHEVRQNVERAMSACWNGFAYDSVGRSLGLESDIPTKAPLPNGFPRAMSDDLKKSYLHQMLESVVGVDYVNLTQLQRVPYARKLHPFGASPTWSSIVVGDVALQTLVIEFTGATTFTVTSDVLGLNGSGTTGTPYNGFGSLQIQFTITDGSIPHFAGNKYEIKLGAVLDTIACDEYELLSNYNDSVSYQYGDEVLDGVTAYPYWSVTYVGGIT